MYCKRCGKEIDNGSAFCRYCGSRVEQGYIPPDSAGKPGYIPPDSVGRQGYIPPDSVGRPAGSFDGRPAGGEPGKGNRGKILLIALVAGAVCVAAALAVALFLFVKNLVADGNLSETFPFLAEDEEGRILGGKLDKSSLPAFVRNLLEEEETEEDEGEEPEDSEAVKASEGQQEKEPGALFEEALSELVSVYGVFNANQSGIMRQTSDRWLNPRGVISATIADFDQDDEKEMMVCRMEPSEGSPDSCELVLGMYEVVQEEAVLADEVPFHAYNDKWEERVSLSEAQWEDVSYYLNLVRSQNRLYLMCEQENLAKVFADGQDRNYWTMVYEDGSWQYASSFTQTDGGSSGFAYTGYEFEEGALVNSQVYYDQEGRWRGSNPLYADFSTAIREFFGRQEIRLRSESAEYGFNEGSILSGDNDRTAVFTFHNVLSHVAGQSMVYQCQATMNVDPKSAVSGEPVPALSPSSSVSEGADYLLPDVDSRYLSREEISRLSKEELRLARNEVYARHGRMFNSADLQNYFNKKSWYQGRIPANQFSDSVFNDYERKNLDLIREIEDNRQ